MDQTNIYRDAAVSTVARVLEKLINSDEDLKATIRDAAHAFVQPAIKQLPDWTLKHEIEHAIRDEATRLVREPKNQQILRQAIDNVLVDVNEKAATLVVSLVHQIVQQQLGKIADDVRRRQYGP